MEDILLDLVLRDPPISPLKPIDVVLPMPGVDSEVKEFGIGISLFDVGYLSTLFLPRFSIAPRLMM